MKKQAIEEFINKYSLNGVIERTRWISNATTKELKVGTTPDDQNLLVDVTLSNWDGLGDCEIGFADSKKVKTALKGLSGDTVTITTAERADKTITSLSFDDGESKNDVMACDLDIVPKFSTLKTTVPYNVEIVIDVDFRERFLKAKTWLSEVNHFTVLNSKKGPVELVIGYSNINSNKSTLKVKTNAGKDVLAEPIHFNAVYLKEILAVNSSDATLYVSDDGMATIRFQEGDFNCSYHLVSISID